MWKNEVSEDKFVDEFLNKVSVKIGDDITDTATQKQIITKDDFVPTVTGI